MDDYGSVNQSLIFLLGKKNLPGEFELATTSRTRSLERVPKYKELLLLKGNLANTWK